MLRPGPLGLHEEIFLGVYYYSLDPSSKTINGAGDLLRVDGHARGGEAQHSLAVTERTAERAEEAVRRRCTSTLLKQGIASLVVLLCAESG